MVTAYVGEAAPIGSSTLSHLMTERLSSATIRGILADLTRLGLVEQPHPSAGRVPTERGLRLFVDELVAPDRLEAYERRTIAYSVDDADPDGVMNVASQLLSERTRQLGFVVAPRLDRLVLRHVSLVRLTSDRVLVVIVAEAGSTHQRIIEGDPEVDQAELERIALLLNERVVGRTLAQAHRMVARETRALRRRASRLLARVIALGANRGTGSEGEPVDLVIETRLALLEQPEFRDPRRLRDLFAAVETKERLLEVIDQVLEGDGVCVAFGDELQEVGLRDCALVATRYGGEANLGALGVIGPRRMDFGRVIPLVDYLSQVLTGRLGSQSGEPDA